MKGDERREGVSHSVRYLLRRVGIRSGDHLIGEGGEITLNIRKCHSDIQENPEKTFPLKGDTSHTPPCHSGYSGGGKAGGESKESSVTSW